jgi:hypothetical protein
MAREKVAVHLIMPDGRRFVVAEFRKAANKSLGLTLWLIRRGDQLRRMARKRPGLRLEFN